VWDRLLSVVFDSGGDSDDRFLEDRSRGGEVQPHAARAVRPERNPWNQRHAGVFEQILRWFDRELEAAKVEPGEVGRLGDLVSHFR
jgi:hypothetical protein